MEKSGSPYFMAQAAVAQLKAAVHTLLRSSPHGLRNVEIGRALGIYMGHDQQHEGHIPRVLLAIMETEGVVEQDDDTKAWRLRA